jgi:tRNA(Arg) A34 adenosine deaminase TadA
MTKTDDEYMEIAYKEACRSLREGNYGFGAVIIDDDGEVVCSSHDTEKTEADSTLHAELTAIRTASKKRGHDLSNCKIFCTHEPCPMCSTAIYWSGIREIAYSFTIQEALHENRKRLDIGCREIFRRAGCDVEIAEHILYDKCKYLYLKEIREEIKKLRNKDKKELERLGDLIKEKRIRWAHENHSEIGDATSLMTGYKALLKKLDISENDAPILHRDENTILFHSRN